MARKSKKPLSDSEILSIIGGPIRKGARLNDTKLSREREKTTDYYNGKLPAPVHGGNSKYVSTDVFDSVEAMKATLVETFSAGPDIVKFAPEGDDDLQSAKVATAYSKHVFFEQNAGIEILEDVIHDGLMARIGVAKVFWEEIEKEIEEEFEDLSEDALAMLLQDPEVELLELEYEETDEPEEYGKVSGKLKRKCEESQVRIQTIPPEEFIVPPDIKCLEDAPCSHRTEKTRTELLEEGYEKSKVDALSPNDDELAFDPERLSRFDPVSDSTWRDDRDSQRSNDVFVIYETYHKLDADGSGKSRLWKIVHCGSTILDKEQVDRLPFFIFAPLRTPHSFMGGNFAARVIPTQNSKTVLTRSILDHAVQTNNPRMGVVKGALTNPRELLDNRIGGLVNVTRPDGIFPLPQAPLNPFVFQTIAMLDEDKEDVTGVSRLSQGLNKDAISNQNSEGMVEKLIGSSMMRQKAMARSMARQFLAPLFIEIYRLVVEHEDKEKIIEVGGEYVPITPAQWKSLRGVNVELHLGYGELDRNADQLLAFGKMLAEDPILGPQFKYEQRYSLMKEVYETKGRRGLNQFLPNPKEAEAPPPNPKDEAEVALLKQEIELNERKQKLSEVEKQHTMELEKLREDFDQRFKTMEYMLSVQEVERKSLETDNRIVVATKEIELAERSVDNAAPENTKASAIISPNG